MRLDATAIAQFDTAEEAYLEWDKLGNDTLITVGKNEFWVFKYDISIMSEDEFNRL